MKMNKKTEKMVKITENMSENDYLSFIEIVEPLITNEEREYLNRNFATKNLRVYSKKINESMAPVNKIYFDEINKINHILENDKLLKKLEGLRVLFHGKTGTGKTTLLKQISKKNKKIEFISINIEEIVSPKLGQTQVNLLSLSEKLNKQSEEKKIAIFFDELDSVINRRVNSNEVGEHTRIIATFIKFLDLLNKNIIIFAATNMIDNIDEAVIRRFNIKIEGKYFGLDDFIDFYNYESTNGKISRRVIFDAIQNKNELFTLSDLNSFIEYAEIEKSINNSFDESLLFLDFFKNKISVNIENLSERTKTKLNKGEYGL